LARRIIERPNVSRGDVYQQYCVFIIAMGHTSRSAV
jgi:hypothetical protein